MKPPVSLPSLGCAICNKSAEIHHIKTRKSGGSDHWKNTIPLCRQHHSMVHSKGNVYMCENYPSYRENLKGRNWTYCDFRKKWVNHDPEIVNH